MRNILLLVAVVSLASCSPSLARADEPAAAPFAASPASTGHESWYGWQPLLVDAASIASMVGGGFAQGAAGDTAIVFGSAGVVLGAPMIHLGHGHTGKAATSLALRILLPLGATLTGALVGDLAAPRASSPGTGWYEAMGGFAGLLSGGALAIGIDDVVLSREAVAPPAERHPTIEPRISSVRGGATFGVGGTF
jgi:hypothetical protein